MENVPLPELLRPKKLKDFVGQENLVGKDGIITKLLSKQVTNNFFPSLIFLIFYAFLYFSFVVEI